MSADAYLLLRATHVTCVSVSLVLFLLRSWWCWRDLALRSSRWARVVPHVNDSLLLLAGIGLAVTLHQYPLAVAWLTAKLAGLVVHILLGMAALRGWVHGRWAGAAWIGSIAAFGYVLAVAISRNPWIGLAT